MTKVDLITGFLGAGKTTFILEYVKELVQRGERIGVIENDYGAINVDLLLLHEELGDKCRLEMVIGGDPDCHRRRLKTKLIAMGIDRYDRVIVEPSGLFDVDEFMDLLYEEPLEHMLRLENVIAVVDADAVRQQVELRKKEDAADGRAGYSEETRYILAEELTKAGCVLLSKSEELSPEGEAEVTDYLNECLLEVGCKRSLSEKDILVKREGRIDEAGWERILSAGSRDAAYVKKNILKEGTYRSVFFFHVTLPDIPVDELMRQIFTDPECGNPVRIKGFVPDGTDGWIMINATKEQTEVEKSSVGQPVIIVIGERINEDKIGSYWAAYENEYRN